MEYRSLGQSGLKVSPICVGTMTFGGRTDEAEAARIVASARDAGINFIDTADYYTGGQSEAITGHLVGPDRDWWVLATKAGFRSGPGANEEGTGRLHLQASVEGSLRRLGTDRIDLFYVHRDDETVPLEETVQAVGDLLRAGKIRYFGLSNIRGWRIAQVVGLCRELGIPRPIVVQPYYNAMNRQPEVEVLPAAAHLGLGVVPYSPLARGVLTGKYRQGERPPADSRAGVGDTRMLETEWREELLRLVEQLAERARHAGMTTGQLALNWLLDNELVSAVLAGPRTLGQWHEYLGALEHPFTAEDSAFFDRLVPPGQASTHGYTDPSYPVLGRVSRATRG